MASSPQASVPKPSETSSGQSSTAATVDSTSSVPATATIELGETRLSFSISSEELELPLSRRTKLGGLLGHSEVMRAVFAVLERMGVEHGCDVYGVMDVAEDLVVPMMVHPIRVDRDALTLGYAGVYSSFLLFAKRAEARYGVPARDILMELGRRKTVGGQEDMI